MKPLVRWIVGPTTQEGLNCLEESISMMKRLYGLGFDYMVCYNNQDPNNLDFDVLLVDQQEFSSWLPLPPSGPSWKLYPARLRPDAHEIIIDNDLLLYRRPAAFDTFLRSDDVFLGTVAAKRNYGQFNPLIPKLEKSLNSGIIGLPPGYDFAQKIQDILSLWHIDHWTHYCEQGLVASLVLGKKYILIDIPVCIDWMPFTMGKLGMHFVGLNSGYTEMWDKFQRHRLF